MKRVLILTLALAVPGVAATLVGCDDDDNGTVAVDATVDGSETATQTDVKTDVPAVDTGTAVDTAAETNPSADASTSETKSETSPADGSTDVASDGAAVLDGSTDALDGASETGSPADAIAATVHNIAWSFGGTFAPLNIKAGDVVTWTWTGNHGVTEADSDTATGRCSAKIGGFQSGGSSPFSRTFSTPGTYNYFCPVGSHCQNGGMYGTIIVQ